MNRYVVTISLFLIVLTAGCVNYINTNNLDETSVNQLNNIGDFVVGKNPVGLLKNHEELQEVFIRAKKSSFHNQHGLGLMLEWDNFMLSIVFEVIDSEQNDSYELIGSLPDVMFESHNRKRKKIGNALRIKSWTLTDL